MIVLEKIWCWFSDLVGTVTSTIIALIRLMFLLVAFIASGVQIILFTRTEVCNVEMKGQPFRCDTKKMAEQIAYVDKLCLENPDLLGMEDTFPSNEGLDDLGDEGEQPLN